MVDSATPSDQAEPARPQSSQLRALTPLVNVRSIEASRQFYEKLGFEVDGSFTPDGETTPSWMSLRSGRAEIMISADESLESTSGVLLYIYCNDVKSLRATLLERGLEPGEISYPFFNPGGEFQLTDPDGYVIFVT